MTTAEQIEMLMEMRAKGGIENLHPALKPWLEETVLGLMVKHPYVFVHVGAEGLFVENANRMYGWKRKVRREYLNERNWRGYLLAHERPYRMMLLERLYDRGVISQSELAEVLLDIWVDTEAPEVNQEIPIMLFREVGFITDNPERWDELPDEITVYRGVDGDFERTATGPSWTLDLRVAKFFAYRFNQDGGVYSYTCDKDEALAFITGRDEAEIILDFDAGGGGVSDDGLIEFVEGKDDFR